MQRVLAAVDGSMPSLRAVAFAADLASKYSAELIILTVGPALSVKLTSELEEHIDAPLNEWRSADAEGMLAGARLEAEAQGAKQIFTQSSIGDAAEEIIGVAKDKKADLIVVGSRGLGRLAGLLLGSVAQKVLAHAACPVLIVR